MRRVWAGVGQAIESAAIAAVSFGVTALVLLVVWAFDQGFGGDPLVQWRVAVDAWLLGHGVRIGITLAPEAIGQVGIAAATQPFSLSLGAWGIGLITLWLHWRSGQRLAELSVVEIALATVSGAATTGLAGLLLAATAQHATAAADLGQAFAFPAAVAATGIASAVFVRRGPGWFAEIGRSLTVDAPVMRSIGAALRSGLAGAVGVLGVGALLVAGGLALRSIDAIVLFEALEPTPLGVAVLFLAQLAFLPVAVVWGAAWAVGPGFALGAGSTVSPLATTLGPVPSLPLLAAIPPEVPSWAPAVVALPVLVGAVVGVVTRQTVLAGRADRRVHWWELAIASVGGAVVTGLVLGAPSALATGSAGPGRLAETGPDALLVGAWGALEVGIGLALGLVFGARVPEALATGAALPLAAEDASTSLWGVLGLGRADVVDREAGDDGEAEDAAGAEIDSEAEDEGYSETRTS